MTEVIEITREEDVVSKVEADGTFLQLSLEEMDSVGGGTAITALF